MKHSRVIKAFAIFLCAGTALSIVPHNLGGVVNADTTVDQDGLTASDCSYQSVEDFCFIADEAITAQWY